LVRHEEHHGDHTHGAHTDMSFNVGAGTQVGLGRLNLYVEARYHRLREEAAQVHGATEHAGNTFVPVTFGVRF
jgi:hypothetical protein